MKEYSRFIAKVSQALARERYSVRQLALAIGLDPSYLTRVLAGERNPPADEHIRKIGDLLRLDPDELLMDVERLPLFLRATGPLDEKDMQSLRRVAGEIRQRHRARRPDGGHDAAAKP